MTKNLLILAAGASSRMKNSKEVEGLSKREIESANTQSKALIGYGDSQRPILDFLLQHAKKAGYQKIYLIVGEQAEAFQSFYGTSKEDNHYNGLLLSYATQFIPKGRSKPYGTADAIYQAMVQYPNLQQESFTVCNCDNLYSVNAMKALRETTAKNAFIAYDRDGLNFSLERISRFALVRLTANQDVEDIIEKPKEDQLDTYRDAHGTFRVSMNIFTFDGASMFPYFKDCPVHPERDEKEIPTAIRNYCRDHPNAFKGIPFCEHVPDLTSKEDIKIFKKYLDNYSS
ncbi:MAG: NTP transferase domain-containing protein [Bacteroidetes bacterium]|nr:NTP transferase domain-containing protein [Bacteroidota bacterium]